MRKLFGMSFYQAVLQQGLPLMENHDQSHDPSRGNIVEKNKGDEYFPVADKIFIVIKTSY